MEETNKRRLVISENSDGSITMEGCVALLQKAMEVERRTGSKEGGLFSGMGKGMPKMPEMSIGNLGSSKAKMPDMGMDFSAMKGGSSGFGNAPSVGKLEKPTKGFGDIVGKGSSLPEMPEVRMPESFGLDIIKRKKK